LLTARRTTRPPSSSRLDRRSADAAGPHAKLAAVVPSAAKHPGHGNWEVAARGGAKGRGQELELPKDPWLRGCTNQARIRPSSRVDSWPAARTPIGPTPHISTPSLSFSPTVEASMTPGQIGKCCQFGATDAACDAPRHGMLGQGSRPTDTDAPSEGELASHARHGRVRPGPETWMVHRTVSSTGGRGRQDVRRTTWTWHEAAWRSRRRRSRRT
jgi:hypothetical protein